VKLKRSLHRARGFALILAVFLIVSLAAIGAYLLTVSNVQVATGVMDEQGARAYQAARAGLEWGAYQVLQNSGGSFATTNCVAGTGGAAQDVAPLALDLHAGNVPGSGRDQAARAHLSHHVHRLQSGQLCRSPRNPPRSIAICSSPSQLNAPNWIKGNIWFCRSSVTTSLIDLFSN
jgi:hypothetical protein